jgi:tetratricopeptide (TPR) repeat protein
MMTSRTFLALSLAASVALGASAADAQRSRGNQQQQQQGGQLSREENAALQPVQAAVQAQNWEAANTALQAAQASIQSPYGRYVVGQFQLQIGIGTNNQQIQSQAVDTMLASGGAPAERVNALLDAQVAFAIQAQNYAVAETGLTRLLEGDPNNVERISTLGQVKLRLNKNDEAAALFRRALELSTANGQTAPEDVYRRALATVYQARQAGPAIDLARQLATAYPTRRNWRDALTIYRELGGIDGGMELDVRRLMRAAGALTSEADYVEYAEAVYRAGLPGEVKAVLDEGVSRNVLRAGGPQSQLLANASEAIAGDRAGLAGQRAAAMAAPEARRVVSLADAYASYGQDAEAIELYRAALQKAGADADLINIRLGAALFRAGQRAEAETAFRAVTGQRQQLANFWLAFLAHPPTA